MIGTGFFPKIEMLTWLPPQEQESSTEDTSEMPQLQYLDLLCYVIVSAHRLISGMASVVCVLVKTCVSSISLYKLDPDKLTTPFESAHQFTLVCTVSDFKTVPVALPFMLKITVLF